MSEEQIVGGQEVRKNKKKMWIIILVAIAFLFIYENSKKESTESKPKVQEIKIEEVTEAAKLEIPKIEEVIEEVKVEEEAEAGIKEVDLLPSSPYTPAADVYTNQISYNNNTFRLAFKGDFETATLSIKAESANNLKNFLSFNLSVFSGIYSDGENAISFNTEDPLGVTIDLKNKEQFTKASDVILWDRLEPAVSKDNATIARIYAMLFDEKGIYSNQSEITEFKLTYLCSDDDPDCEAVICDDVSQSGGTCLIEKFGVDAAKSYIDYFSK